MSLVKQIENKSAVSAWSPLSDLSNVIALGTKDSSGGGFDSHGGELEIHSMDFWNPDLDTKVLGKAKFSSRFSSITWSNAIQSLQYGLIAGGMIDGVINVWNPGMVMEGLEDSLTVSLEQHQGSVTSLHFNPHKDSSHLLATGGSDGEVYVISLDKLDTPSVFIPAPNATKHTADVTAVSWNSQVAHILASASQQGSCFVWDLRQKRAWCELREPSGGPVSDIAWNPDQGLHIVTASGDDRNPVLKLWDLRSSTSLPLATLSGHSEGILSISWCNTDPSLLISCGKDSKTIIWDLFHLQPVYELPHSQRDRGHNVQDDMLFNPLALSASHRRHHVSWSPGIPAVVATASFDRRIQFYSVSGMQSKAARAPKWLRRPVTCAMGFGGKLVVVNNSLTSLNTRKTNACGKIHVYQITENVDVINESDEFHGLLAERRFKELCELKALRCPEESKLEWMLMRVICFGDNAREELLSYLGFDSANISEMAKTCSEKLQTMDSQEKPLDTFSQIETLRLINQLNGSAIAESSVRKALIVGNFEMAVECCLQAGLFAEALLLSQCGGAELKAKTQAFFFEKRRSERSFLSILHSVIKGQLLDYVTSSDLDAWKETLALLSTYAKSEEFPALCEALANRLEFEKFDRKSAALCYMCAANVEKTIKYWTEELQAANSRQRALDITALQDYVEKVLVFVQANPLEDLGVECGSFFADYAVLLANQGRLTSASNYLKGDSLPVKVLADRIYHAGSKPAGSRPPPFPFSRGDVEGVTAAVSHSQPRKTEEVKSLESHRRHDTGSKKPLGQQPSPVAESVVLPNDWVQLFDPVSNRVYYANQLTGQSQWDLPVATATTANSTVTVVEDSNKANLNLSAGEAEKSVSVTTHNNEVKEPIVSPQRTSVEVECVIALGQMIEAIAAGPLSIPEKKQIVMLRGSYQLLTEKLKKNELSDDVLGKLSLLVDSLCAKNFLAATSIQTDLVNTAWSQHKEWLKGVKVLIQLASRK